MADGRPFDNNTTLGVLAAVLAGPKAAGSPGR